MGKKAFKQPFLDDSVARMRLYQMDRICYYIAKVNQFHNTIGSVI